MRILFFTFGSDASPSSRYRVFQYTAGLKEAGWEIDIVAPRPGESSTRAVLRALRPARRADLLFIQKRLVPPLALRALRWAAKGRIIYDYDDALFARHHTERDTWSHRRSISRLKACLTAARIVIAGNDYLAKYALDFNPRVEILPTSVDMACHPRRPAHAQKSPQVVGWVGTSSNFSYLNSIAPALQELTSRRAIVLQVVSNGKFEHADLNIQNISWEKEREAELLHSFDVGLMPLADNQWTRGKCAFKAIQYMAVGVPVVCSPVGANKQVITEGTEGFFAATPAEWADRMNLLLEDAELREKMGGAGRETAHKRFSVQANLPRFVEILRQAAEEPRS